MNKLFFKKSLVFFFLLTMASACSTGRSFRHLATDDFVNKNFVEAERKLNSPQITKEKKQTLLTLVELGALAHYKREYLKSNIYFEEAKEYLNKMYGTRAREVISSFVLNDTSSTYKGMDYENSLIYYYKVLNFLNLYNQKKQEPWVMQELKIAGTTVLPESKGDAKEFSSQEIAQFVSQARSEVLAWDSFLENVRAANLGEPYYKDELLAKLLGGYVHKLTDKLEDVQIAKTLFKDANQLMVRAYSAYPTFNNTSKKYIDDYAKFPELGEENVLANYIRKTDYYEKLEKKINFKINTINSKDNNVFIVLENGTIPEKREKPYVIGLSTVLKNIEDPGVRHSVEMIGAHVLIQLAPEVGFGMLMAGVVGAIKNADVDDRPVQLSDAIDSAIGIEFKLPDVKTVTTSEKITLTFINKKTNEKHEIETILVEPLNDIAKLNVERRASGIALKTGLRVGVKMLPGLIAAVAAYKQTPEPAILKMMAGTAVWMSAKAIVDATEKADIRAWNMLPKGISLAETRLPDGDYTVSAHVKRNEFADIDYALGDFSVKGGNNIFNGRIFYRDYIPKIK